jgi:hypothetical protein
LVEGLYTIPASVFRGCAPVEPVVKRIRLEASVASSARVTLSIPAVEVTEPEIFKPPPTDTSPEKV